MLADNAGPQSKKRSKNRSACIIIARVPSSARPFAYEMTDSVSLPDEEPILRVVPMPADANMHGDVFGGWIMSQVDIAGGILAARRANGRVATVAVTSFVFKQPVFVGDLLSFYGTIVRTGRTSITVEVSVYTERSRLKVETAKVTEATLVYVATDEQRQPRVLPPLED
jgi:acyl-CoA thioesterase YciA